MVEVLVVSAKFCIRIVKAVIRKKLLKELYIFIGLFLYTIGSNEQMFSEVSIYSL